VYDTLSAHDVIREPAHGDEHDTRQVVTPL
jgi:hypothetical protein